MHIRTHEEHKTPNQVAYLSHKIVGAEPRPEPNSAPVSLSTLYTSWYTETPLLATWFAGLSSKTYRGLCSNFKSAPAKHYTKRPGWELFGALAPVWWQDSTPQSWQARMVRRRCHNSEWEPRLLGILSLLCGHSITDDGFHHQCACLGNLRQCILFSISQSKKGRKFSRWPKKQKIAGWFLVYNGGGLLGLPWSERGRWKSWWSLAPSFWELKAFINVKRAY